MKETQESFNSKIKYGITLKIIVMVTVVIIAICSILSALSYNKSNQLIQQAHLEQVEGDIDFLNETINNLIERAKVNTTLIENLPYIKAEMTAEDIANMEDYFKLIATNNPEIINVLYCTDEEIFIYPYTDMAAGQQPKNADWYTSRIHQEGFMWKNPHIDGATGKWIISVFKAVKKDDVTIGLIEIDISLEHIEELIGKINVGEIGHIMITDYNGSIQYHKNKELIGTDIPDEELYHFVVNNTEGELNYKSTKEQKIVKLAPLVPTLEWKAIGVLSKANLAKASKGLLGYIVLATLILAVVGIGCIAFATKHMIRRIINFSNNFEKMGQGYLNVKAEDHGKDEIGQMAGIFNKMITSLNGLIKGTKVTCVELLERFTEIRMVSDQTIEASNKISSALAKVSMDAVEQVNQTDEMVEHFEELSSAMGHISESITDVNKLFVEAKTVNASGIEVVEHLLQITEETNQSTQNVKDVIYAINESSSQIDSIVGTINAISEQTNLLALNASIEAARAGESGRGFAVVAEEVRKLAEQSGASAGEIRELIDRVQQQTMSAVKEIETTRKKVEVQNKAAANTGESFKSISLSIENLSSNVDHIAGLNKEMIEIKARMFDMIQKVAEMAKDTSLSTDEMSAYIEEQIATMDHIVEMLIISSDTANKLSDEMKNFRTE